MLCNNCNKEMKEGYLFTSKDGSFSFGSLVPGVFKKAKKTPGFVKITDLTVGHRVNVKAFICHSCRKVIFEY